LFALGRRDFENAYRHFTATTLCGTFLPFTPLYPSLTMDHVETAVYRAKETEITLALSILVGKLCRRRPYRRLWIVESNFRTSGSMPKVDHTSATDVPLCAPGGRSRAVIRVRPSVRTFGGAGLPRGGTRFRTGRPGTVDMH
jgi:hypothetical protein